MFKKVSDAKIKILKYIDQKSLSLGSRLSVRLDKNNKVDIQPWAGYFYDKIPIQAFLLCFSRSNIWKRAEIGS